jgi:hypothetical protein
VIPSLVTQLVALLKDSTLSYVVSYPELMKQANNPAGNTKRPGKTDRPGESGPDPDATDTVQHELPTAVAPR